MLWIRVKDVAFCWGSAGAKVRVVELWGENVKERRGDEVAVGFEGEEGVQRKTGLEEANGLGSISAVLEDGKMQHQKIEGINYCII